MGKFQSKLKSSTRNIPEETLQLFKKQELKELITVFNKLSKVKVGEGQNQGSNNNNNNNNNNGLNEDQFAQYFSYPGVLRKQIFKVFDRNGDGCIDKEEFLKGLAMCCRGPIDEKLRFVFSMCDLNEDAYVDKAELKNVLTSTAFSSFALLQAVALEEGKISDQHAIKNSNEFEEEINYMVNAAFESSDVNNDGLLSFDEFVKWLFNTPEILNIIYSVFEIRDHVEVADVKQELEIRRRSLRHLELQRKLESEEEEKKLGLHRLDSKTKKSLSIDESLDTSGSSDTSNELKRKDSNNHIKSKYNSMNDSIMSSSTTTSNSKYSNDNNGRNNTNNESKNNDITMSKRFTTEDEVKDLKKEDETMYNLIELMIDTEDALSILAKEKVVNEGVKERINELERENEKLRARKQKSSDKK